MLLFLDCETYARPLIAEKFSDKENPKAYVATSPFLAQVICIGTNRIPPTCSPDECQLLFEFNALVDKTTVFVTFAGRRFDLPLIYHRMLANGIAPHHRISDALNESRYRPEVHFDLQEILSFNGAIKTPSLREVCLAYGLRDPKASCSGVNVQELFEQGRYYEVAQYCAGDVRAVQEIYAIWGRSKR